MLFEHWCSCCSRIGVEYGEHQCSNILLTHLYLRSSIPVKSSDTDLQTTSLGTLSFVRELVLTTKGNVNNEGIENENTTQVLEPVEQEAVAFHQQNIIAVRLADGRICVVLRWICESLKLAPNPQVRRIERTDTLADELVRVRVQTRGGRQTMPALTLRGFSPWILSLNPGEITDVDLGEQERIRALVIAYQREAKDVLYEHFVNRSSRIAFPVREDSSTVVLPMEPMKPGPEATDEERATYYENLSLWARWQADQYAQQWRGQVDEWRGQVEARIESNEAISRLLPEIIERLGPETITPQHHQKVKTLAKQLHLATGKPYPTIYDDLKMVFEKGRIEDLLEEEWEQVENWFRVQIERAKDTSRRS